MREISELTKNHPPLPRLHEITESLGEIGLLQRFGEEVEQQPWTEEDRELVYLAEGIALAIHSEDSRGENPYSTHLLRVAIRIMSKEHFDVQNPAIVAAALLHDAAEDHPEHFRGIILLASGSAHEKDFSSSVSQLVAAVTSPTWPEGISSKEKNTRYQEHVRSTLTENKEAGIIKLSDFIDNCSGIRYNEDPEKAKRLAHKYTPLIPDFTTFVKDSPIIPEGRKPYILDQLVRTKERCLDLLAA